MKKRISPQQRREHSDPHENNRPVPWLLWGLALSLGVFGVAYIFTVDPDSAPEWGDDRTLSELTAGTARAASGAPGVLDGASLFAARCAACHQANGAGLAGVFPPLAGSEWVNGSEHTLVAIVLNGVQGELMVSSQAYNGVMPPFKDQLNDAEVAAIATYIRGTWGNSSGPVAVESVARLRSESAGRGPFNGGAELATLGGNAALK